MKKLLRRWLGIEEDQHRSAECVVANFEKTAYVINDLSRRVEALERAQRNRDDYLLRLRSVEIRTEIIARRMRDAVSELERYEGTKTDVR